MNNEIKEKVPSFTGPIILMWAGFCAPVIVWIPGFIWGMCLVRKGGNDEAFYWNAVISFAIYFALIAIVMSA